jgi:hypothetical protein
MLGAAAHSFVEWPIFSALAPLASRATSLGRHPPRSGFVQLYFTGHANAPAADRITR